MSILTVVFREIGESRWPSGPLTFFCVPCQHLGAQRATGGTLISPLPVSKVAVGSRRARVPQQEEEVAWGGVAKHERKYLQNIFRACLPWPATTKVS